MRHEEPTPQPKNDASQRPNLEGQNRAGDLKCFKCLRLGHYARDCPNQRRVLLNEQGEYEYVEGLEDQEEDSHETQEEAEVHAMREEGECFVVQRTLFMTESSTTLSQREVIFHTH